MFRVIFYLLLTVVAISVLKSIVGILLKGVAQAMKASRRCGMKRWRFTPLMVRI